MRLFDTKVQLLKYKVLRGVAKRAWEDHLESSYYEIPLEIVPGKEATMRCCIYKELRNRFRTNQAGNGRRQRQSQCH